LNTPVDLGAGLLRTVVSSAGAATLAVFIALLLGSIAARRGGIYDDLLRRSVEFAGALPMLVAIPLLGRVWPLTLTSVVVLGVHQGLCLACVFRNEVERAAGVGFVVAARSLGLGARRTQQRHVLPFALPLLMVGALLVVPKVVSVEAALRYLELDTSESMGGFLVAQGGVVGLTSSALLLVTLVVLHRWTERLIARILQGGRQNRVDRSCEAQGTE